MSDSSGQGTAAPAGQPAAAPVTPGIARGLRPRPGTAPAPAAADGAAAAAGDGQQPAASREPPRRLGSSPRLRGGHSIETALAKLSQVRADPGATDGAAATRPDGTMTRPDGIATTADRRPARARPAAGAGAPAAGATDSGATDGADPLDGLIDRMRTAGVGGAAASATGAAAGATPAGAAATATGAAAAPAAGGPIELAIDGKSHQFTSEQLVSAVRMSADYTKKAQDLAALTRSVNERAAYIDEITPILIPEIERRLKEMEGTEDEIGWQRLYESDPAEYHRRDAIRKDAQAERERLTKLTEAQSRQTQEDFDKRVREGHQTLLEALPGWGDPAMRGRMQSEMIKWGRANKFTDSELNTINEPRHVIALCKAMMFDRMMGRVSTDAPRIPSVRNNAGSLPEPAAGGVAANADTEASFKARPNVNNGLAVAIARRRAAAAAGAR